MKSLIYQLPTVFGSLAAMLVALISIINETPPVTCLVKAVSAFILFAGFGIIIRYALTATEERTAEKLPSSKTNERENAIEKPEEGTTTQPHTEADTASNETNAAPPSE